MAQSRLEKIGTIFSRVSGLLRGGAMKQEDRPLWYDVYAAFPPKLEPVYARPAPVYIKIKDIFYADDIPRAKFHKTVKQHGVVNLLDTKTKSHAQSFVEIYNKYKNEGALDDEKIFSCALDAVQGQLGPYKETNSPDQSDQSTPETKSTDISTDSAGNIDVKNIFN